MFNFTKSMSAERSRTTMDVKEDLIDICDGVGLSTHYYAENQR